MLRKLRIVPRFVGVVVGGWALSTAIIFGFLYSSVLQMMDDAERRELASIFENVQASIIAQGNAAQALSALVAGMPDVQQAMAAGDR